jgi:hypothetical protein
MVKEASVYVKPSAISVTKGDTMSITVRARLKTKTIDHVDLYVKNKLYTTLTEAPYTVDYVPTALGKYALKAVVVADDSTKYERLSNFTAYNPRAPYKGEIERRVNGSMIALETGNAFAYAIDKLQDRGKFFIDPGEDVYMGQVVGEHVHDNDLVINVCKAKQLTNVRASGTDDKARIIPKVVMSLEECLEYIKEDELVEVTPKSMRMRKIILDHDQRKKANKN